MKKGFYAILAALAVFALVMTACPTDEGTKTTTPYTPSKNTSLSSLQVGTLEPASTSTGNSKSTAALVSTFVVAPVSTSENDAVDSSHNPTGVEVTLTKGSSFRGTMAIAVVHDGDPAPDESAFAVYSDTSKPKFIFVEDDKIYVKMTAEDTTVVAYYGFKVEIGNDATLKDITFSYTYDIKQNGTVVGQATSKVSLATDGSLGEGVILTKDDVSKPDPALDDSDFDEDNQGNLLFRVKQPAEGFDVEAETYDPDTTVKISTDGTTWSDTDTIIFAEDDPLYAKVTSSNGKKIHYYKIIINQMKAVKIPYGTPSTVNAASPDAIWDEEANPGKATDWLYIDRANPAEGTGWLDLPTGDKSFGRAKLMWDEDGIWVYAQVWEKTISPVGQDTYDASSVELFINEAADAVTTGLTPPGGGDAVTTNVTSVGTVMGGQYRLSANGVRTTPQTNQQAVFEALEASAKKYESDNFPYVNPKKLNDLKTGYVVIFHAPWRFPNYYPLADQKDVYIELQINATKSTGTRAGVLNWNNIVSNSYGSLADYGAGTLELNGNLLKPQKPVITGQPASVKVEVDATNLPSLTVIAESVDSGTLGYEWYKVGETSDTKITGATDKTLALTSALVDTSDVGEFFFYAVVSNTKAGVSRTTTSSRAKVEVYDPNATANTIELAHDGVDDWNATAGGLVKSAPASQYGDIVSLPIARDLDRYVRLEVRYAAYTTYDAETPANNVAAKPITSQYSNDIIVEVYDSTGTSKGQFGFNAGGILKDLDDNFAGLFYTFDNTMKAATYGDAAKFTLKLKYGTNTATDPLITKFVIKSVQIVSAEPLELDLSNELAAAGWDGGTGEHPAATTATASSISWDFSGADERVAIGLSTGMITQLADSAVKSVRITITGTSTGTTAKYRYYIGTIADQNNWNGTNASNSNTAVPWSKIGSATGVTQIVTFSNNIANTEKGGNRLSAFILRSSAAGNETVTITKIAIYPVVW